MTLKHIQISIPKLTESKDIAEEIINEFPNTREEIVAAWKAMHKNIEEGESRREEEDFFYSNIQASKKKAMSLLKEVQ